MPPAPVLGRVSIRIAGLGVCLFPTPGPLDLAPENAAVGAARAGFLGAVGVGLGLAGVRARARPRWVSRVGPAASFALVLAAAVHIIGGW
jgi:hypothetical protein